jgi:hypothetical protein
MRLQSIIPDTITGMHRLHTTMLTIIILRDGGVTILCESDKSNLNTTITTTIRDNGAV